MITCFRLFISYSFFFMVPIVSATDKPFLPWTWQHSKAFNASFRKINAHKKELLFKKEGVQPFTQLLFSWNIMRPEKGYFSFYIQVRDAQTKEWGKWHHMADWGKNIQKTYLSKSDGLGSCVHVRFELEAHKLADAFSVTLKPCDGASLDNVHGMFVATSDFNQFQAEEIVSITNAIKTTCHIQGVSKIAQFAVDHVDKMRICSPTSCIMVAEYMTGKPVGFGDALNNIFDTGLGVYGSWQCNMAHLFTLCEGKIYCYVRRANSFLDVFHSLQRNIPVVVSVRGEIPGALKPFPHGHLLVIVGYDHENAQVLCNDPAAESNDMVEKRYALEPFVRAWERSNRLMYGMSMVQQKAAP